MQIAFFVHIEIQRVFQSFVKTRYFALNSIFV
jgi:hypothetical protein